MTSSLKSYRDLLVWQKEIELVAQGELKELETDFIVAEKLSYLTAAQAQRLLLQTDELGPMLGTLIRKLKVSSSATTPCTLHPTP
jgi:hypothetical protein